MSATACPIAASLSSHLRDIDRADANAAESKQIYDEKLADLLDNCTVVTRFGQRDVHELMVDGELQDDCYADECQDLRAWVIKNLEPIADARTAAEFDRRKYNGDL
jgi:hypothetical protein